MKQDNIFDDFPDTDSKNLEQMKEDFQAIQTSLKPTQTYKEQLFSRLEAINMYQKGQMFDFKKYSSGLLAFTFLLSFTWYFYSNFLTEDSPKGNGIIQEAQIFSDSGDMSRGSEEIQIMSDDMMGSSRMGGMPFVRSYSEEDRAGFSQACENAEGFYISEDEICILDMTDICDISSYITPSENACSVLFGGMSEEPEILPNEGQ